MNLKIPFLLGLALVVVSCKTDKKNSESATDAIVEEEAISPEQNTLTEQEKNEGWALLFDGETTNGWHLYNKPEAKPIWAAVDGMLVLRSLNGTGDQGDLLTDRQYGNFDLTFEWKLSESGNSGVFLNVQEDPEIAYAWATGPEYQLLDPTHKDFEIKEKRSGCLYGFSPQLTEKVANPAGEWNQGRIKQVNGKAEFYMNGNLTAKVDFNSPEWKEAVAQSGFNKFPGFGLATKGHITLQQWTSPVWFRNLKIREL